MTSPQNSRRTMERYQCGCTLTITQAQASTPEMGSSRPRYRTSLTKCSRWISSAVQLRLQLRSLKMDLAIFLLLMWQIKTTSKWKPCMKLLLDHLCWRMKTFQWLGISGILGKTSKGTLLSSIRTNLGTFTRMKSASETWTKTTFHTQATRQATSKLITP